MRSLLVPSSAYLDWPTGATEKEEEAAEVDLLAVAEEADLIQDERLLDSDEKRKPPRPQDAAAKLADALLALRLEEKEQPPEGDPLGWEVREAPAVPGGGSRLCAPPQRLRQQRGWGEAGP